MPGIQNGKYRHKASGQLHNVIGLAEHTENTELMVLHYNNDRRLLATPYTVFTEGDRYTMIPEDEEFNQPSSSPLILPDCEHWQVS